MATILIVDDISANRKLLVAVLGYQGHRLLEAVDGSEGLAKVRSERPDLVITDVLMPVMDGYEFVRQLRLDPLTRGIPVLFYTAHYGEEEAKALALSSGVLDVITKPAGSAEVLTIVGRVLEGRQTVEAGAPALPTDFDRAHLQLVTDKLSQKVGDLETANARLRALFNIGLEFASERDSDKLLQRVCEAARELFGATYVTLGILEPRNGSVQRFFTCAAEDTCGTDEVRWMKPGDPISGVLRTVVSERTTVRRENPGGDPATLGLPRVHPRADAMLVAPIESPTHVYGWMCLVANDGRVFTMDDEQLLIAFAGQVGRIYELEREILERKDAEVAVRHERDKTQRYLDTAGVILLALDLEGRITLINRYACVVLGWTMEELLGRDWIDTCVPVRIRPALRAQCRRGIAACSASGADLGVVESPVVTRTGEERLIEWRNTLLRTEDGRVMGTFSSGADITERSRAADTVRAAEERMRFALDAADVGIWDMDYVTGTHTWSETLERQYGLDPGMFAGTFEAFVALIHPDDRASVLATIGAATKAGTDFDVHHRAMRPDGKIRWLNGSGRVQLGPNGLPIRAVGISLDVTEHYMLEEQFRQSQKMEAVGRLAGGVAHDFNNMLTAILGYCELMLEDLAPGDPHRADVAEIQKAGLSAAGLTRQLLAFSRKQILEPMLIDLNSVVTDIRPMLGRLIGEDVTIHLGLRPGLARVMADRGQLEQVVLNLAVNARDAMPMGGTLLIETANVELDDDYARMHLSVTPGRYVVLNVTDTGTGMTPEVQARLFEPFFTTKEVGKGTGLGLATVYGIATQGGGSIQVYSEIGRGTSFKVYFPQADTSRISAEVAVVVSRPQSGGETILLVDDEKALRELTRKVLERQGYVVLVAANADEAVGMFAAHATIDLLLTDVVMPGASGPELTRRLMEQRPGLKVIYMSGYTEDAIVQRGILGPDIAFLNKPFSAAALGQKIRELIDRQGPAAIAAGSAGL